MNQDHILSKIDILIQQQKYGEAERILRELLAKEPNNIYFLSLLAEVHLQQENFEVAEKIIENAIGQSPENSHLFFIKARIAIEQETYDMAEQNIEEAIRLAPYTADYYAFLAHIKLSRKQFAKALELANKALEIDAENLLGLNTRSSALLKLNKKEASFETIEGALKEDPNNPYTHTNYGWMLLEKGNHKKALIHFKEALQNDPNFEYAQSGLLEALKAGNPIYRLFLAYAFFMSNLTSKYQWGVIIGFYIGFRILRSIARNNQALEPYLTPLIIFLALVAFSTWVINPISNLFLRFNKYGQLLLDTKEKLSSNFVAGSFLLFILGIVLYLFTQDEKFMTITIYGFSMMLPFSVMFTPSKYKYSLLIYTVVMAFIGILAIGITFSTGELFNPFTGVYLFGFIAFQWVANLLIIKEDNR